VVDLQADEVDQGLGRYVEGRGGLAGGVEDAQGVLVDAGVGLVDGLEQACDARESPGYVH
jgi:hypothetical protein